MATTRSTVRRLIAEGHDPSSPDFLPLLRAENLKGQEPTIAASPASTNDKVG